MVIVNVVVVIIIGGGGGMLIDIVAFLAGARREGLEQFQQAVGNTERGVMLAQLQERPRSTAVFGWRCASAANADRVGPPWLDRQDLLRRTSCCQPSVKSYS